MTEQPLDSWAEAGLSMFSVGQLAPQAAKVAGKGNDPNDDIPIWRLNKPSGFMQFGLVSNDWRSGLLAGELIIPRTNTNRDRVLKTKIGTGAYYYYDFYELPSARWGMPIRAKQQQAEQESLAADIAVTRNLLNHLLRRLSEEQLEALAAAIRTIASSYAGVRDLHKLEMLLQLLAAAEPVDSRGRRNPSARMVRLSKVTAEGQERLGDLTKVEQANRQRSQFVEGNVLFQDWAVGRLCDWLRAGGQPASNPEEFGRLAGQIRHKPELLSCNNAAMRHSNDDVAESLLIGLEVFGPLYSTLAHPVWLVAGSSLHNLQTSAPKALDQIESVSTILNLVRLPGDYGLLLERYGAFVIGCREDLLKGDWSAAKSMAVQAQHLLRYRVLPGQTSAPKEWYLQSAEARA